MSDLEQTTPAAPGPTHGGNAVIRSFLPGLVLGFVIGAVGTFLVTQFTGTPDIPTDVDPQDIADRANTPRGDDPSDGGESEVDRIIRENEEGERDGSDADADSPSGAEDGADSDAP